MPRSSFALSLALVALGVLGAAPLALAQNTGTFTGCVNQTPSSTSSQASNCDVNECNDYCRNLGFAFAFQSASYNSASGFCTCADTSVSDETAYTAGTDLSCAASDLQQTALSTSFNYDQASCYASTDDGEASQVGTGETIETCFQLCAGYRAAFWRTGFVPDQGIDEFSCACTNTDPTAQTGGQTCGYEQFQTGNWYRFTHSAAAAGSNLSKRKMKKRSRSEWCPDGTVACAVRGTDGYECIDTTNELESCGGCTSGLYHSTPNATMAGVDCTTLPGVKRYGVTCARGQCVASACTAGYMLVGGTCLKV